MKESITSGLGDVLTEVMIEGFLPEFHRPEMLLKVITARIEG
jgi:hypothetical protein